MTGKSEEDFWVVAARGASFGLPRTVERQMAHASAQRARCRLLRVFFHSDTRRLDLVERDSFCTRLLDAGLSSPPGARESEGGSPSICRLRLLIRSSYLGKQTKRYIQTDQPGAHARPPHPPPPPPPPPPTKKKLHFSKPRPSKSSTASDLQLIEDHSNHRRVGSAAHDIYQRSEAERSEPP